MADFTNKTITATSFTNKTISGVQIDFVAENGDTYLMGSGSDETLITKTGGGDFTNKDKN